MAASKERIKVAKDTARFIDSIGQQIMEEWGMTFPEIQKAGRDAEFDREIIRRIYTNISAQAFFETSKDYTKESFGTAWECFSEDQQNIIVLKETKLW